MADEWRPIETAPEDGTSVLLWQPTHRGGYVVIAYFDLFYLAWREEEEGISLDPTHWRPLPEPPQQEMDRSNSRA